MERDQESSPSRRVILSGGPGGMPQEIIVGGDLPESLVVDYYGRHEHFQLSGEFPPAQGGPLPLYRWIYSTMIAE